MKKILITTLILLSASMFIVGHVGAEIYSTDSGLLDLWTLDSSRMVNNVIDSGSNGNTGYLVLTGGVSTSTQNVGGKKGQAFSFLAAGTTKVRVPHNANLKPATSMTISAWIEPLVGSITSVGLLREVYRKEDGNDRHLLSFQDSGNCINPSSGGKACISFGISTGGLYLELDCAIPDITQYEGKWSLLTATYDGATKKIYQNGQLKCSAAAAGAIGQTGTSDLYIGSNNTGEFFSGRIDDVRLYNKALTQAQIVQMYQDAFPIVNAF